MMEGGRTASLQRCTSEVEAIMNGLKENELLDFLKEIESLFNKKLDSSLFKQDSKYHQMARYYVNNNSHNLARGQRSSKAFYVEVADYSPPKKSTLTWKKDPKSLLKKTGKPSKPQQQKKISANSMKMMTHSADSPLVDINLRDVINFKTFNSLPAALKDSLLVHLSPVDFNHPSSVERLFNSEAFNYDMISWQENLAAGFLEQGSEALNYLKGKSKREERDPWKEAYYEEYWGQKLKHKHTEENKTPSFSYVEMQSNQPVQPEEDIEPEAVNAFERLISIASDKSISSSSEKDDDYSEKGVKHKKKRKTIVPDNFSESEEDEEEEEYAESHQKKRTKRSTKGADDDDDESYGKTNGFKQSAYTILKRQGKYMNAKEIVAIATREGMLTSSGKTPQNTLASVIYTDIRSNPKCPFMKIRPMTFGLKEWGPITQAREGSTAEEEEEEENHEEEVKEEKSVETPVHLSFSQRRRKRPESSNSSLGSTSSSESLDNSKEDQEKPP
eukprot:TRINITY_DN4765_c0_g4_i1.p1 TRINITY_DN4765_c0_g4~~TRINITY_DN4765_c0_g4_i1.p1  ORF type:complete len:502 (+),score=174.23 TRINITY_DN4765_c0_g4_i1:110-1615(+)